MRLSHAFIPAVPVPMTADGRLHRAAQQQYVRWMSGQPVGGVAVWTPTGRGLRLTPEQRMEVMRDWREGMPRSVPILAAAGGDSTIRAVQMAEDGAAWGADYIVAHSPSFLRDEPGRDALIVEHYRYLGEAGRPLVLLYQPGAAGGISYTPEVLAELCRLPNVAGIQIDTGDSVTTYQDVAGQILQERPDLLLVSGENRFLGYSLMMGADAALVGLGAALTGIGQRLLNSYFAGDWEQFMRLSELVDSYSRVAFADPADAYVKRLLWILALQGIIGADAANDPWGPPVSHSEIDRIQQFLHSLGGA